MGKRFGVRAQNFQRPKNWCKDVACRCVECIPRGKAYSESCNGRVTTRVKGLSRVEARCEGVSWRCARSESFCRIEQSRAKRSSHRNCSQNTRSHACGRTRNYKKNTRYASSGERRIQKQASSETRTSCS